MAAPVVHFEIVGKDGEKLQKFYSELFDWEIDTNNPQKYGLVKPASSNSIGGGVGTVEGDSSPYATFYVEVKDTDAVLEQVKKMGGKIILPTTTIPDMVTYALFEDPEGNMIGLVKCR